MRPLKGAAALAAAALAAIAIAQEDRLVSGPGAALTHAKCTICHEIMHVTRARLSREEWVDNLQRMVERGMPLTEQERVVIVDYLASYYSRDAAPEPAPDTHAAMAQEAGGVTGGDPAGRVLVDGACLGCHSVDKTLVGPAFREVALKYRGQSDAAQKLAAKVRAGGAGVWGQVPMPANPSLSDSDVRLVVDWVLGQK